MNQLREWSDMVEGTGGEPVPSQPVPSQPSWGSWILATSDGGNPVLEHYMGAKWTIHLSNLTQARALELIFEKSRLFVMHDFDFRDLVRALEAVLKHNNGMPIS